MDKIKTLKPYTLDFIEKLNLHKENKVKFKKIHILCEKVKLHIDTLIKIIIHIALTVAPWLHRMSRIG